MRDFGDEYLGKLLVDEINLRLFFLRTLTVCWAVFISLILTPFYPNPVFCMVSKVCLDLTVETSTSCLEHCQNSVVRFHDNRYICVPPNHCPKTQYLRQRTCRTVCTDYLTWAERITDRCCLTMLEAPKIGSEFCFPRSAFSTLLSR